MNDSSATVEEIKIVIDTYLASLKDKEKITKLTKIRTIVVKDRERSEKIAKCITDNKNVEACLIEYDEEMMEELDEEGQ